MTEIELAMMHYDGDGSLPYCDLVWEALKEKRDREKGCPLCREELNEFLPTLEDEETILCLVKDIPKGGGHFTKLMQDCKKTYCPRCGRKIED